MKRHVTKKTMKKLTPHKSRGRKRPPGGAQLRSLWPRLQHLFGDKNAATLRTQRLNWPQSCEIKSSHPGCPGRTFLVSLAKELLGLLPLEHCRDCRPLGPWQALPPSMVSEILRRMCGLCWHKKATHQQSEHNNHSLKHGSMETVILPIRLPLSNFVLCTVYFKHCKLQIRMPQLD